ncbi:hypothetical protein TNCV_3910601 [Trichonephila clavipes]|nr:hypothetical protein TNCV_3910601 [Trichonephila clavipes]
MKYRVQVGDLVSFKIDRQTIINVDKQILKLTKKVSQDKTIKPKSRQIYTKASATEVVDNSDSLHGIPMACGEDVCVRSSALAMCLRHCKSVGAIVMQMGPLPGALVCAAENWTTVGELLVEHMVSAHIDQLLTTLRNNTTAIGDGSRYFDPR